MYAPVSGQMAQFERVCAASFWLTPTRLIPFTWNMMMMVVVMLVMMVMMMVMMMAAMIDDDDCDDVGDDENEKSHLNDMVVDPDSSVTACNGVLHNPLHIDVQLVCKQHLINSCLN